MANFLGARTSLAANTNLASDMLIVRMRTGTVCWFSDSMLRARRGGLDQEFDAQRSGGGTVDACGGRARPEQGRVTTYNETKHRARRFAVTLQGALMQKTGRGSAFRAIEAALCGQATRARFAVALCVSMSEEAPAISAGCWQDAPPGS